MTIQLKFKGVDDWNRPVFKCIDERYKSLYFGDVNKLWSWEHPPKDIVEYYQKNVGALEYFGDHFGCEPHGGMPFTNLQLEIIN